jgi:hypothetical protein
VPQRFYLSRKACLGILRRASARGKALPEILKKALEQQAERRKDTGDGSSCLTREVPGWMCPRMWSARQGGGAPPPVLLDENPGSRRLLYGTQRKRQGDRI